MLLVIGNGFDLSCDVQSNYISFFKWILEKKLQYTTEDLERDGYDDIFDYASFRIERYLKEANSMGISSKRLGNIIPELNSWYFIFIIKKMIYDSDWYQVEDQIASQLFVNENEINIIESIGYSLLSIDDYECGNPEIRVQKISHFKGGNIGKVYRLLAFNLLNKRLDSFKVKSTEEIFIEFRKKKQELWNEYKTKGNIGNKEYDVAFEKRLINELFPLVAQVLLAELRELEKDFNDYLINELDYLDLSYQKKAIDLIYKIFSKAHPVSNSKEAVPYNIISFNYTTPWDRGEKVTNFDEVFENNLIDVKNLHGVLSS